VDLSLLSPVTNSHSTIDSAFRNPKSAMTHFRIVLAYDGTEFVGWQRQATGVSIQGLIEDALFELAGQPVAVAGAGRTDAGVHALGQIAAFSLERSIDANSVLRALNARLPGAVRVRAADAVDASFHPRFDAREKRYEYRIWNAPVANPFERRYVWHIHDSLDVGAMNAAARLVEGRHDFAAFAASGSAAKSTTREIFVSRIAECGWRIGLPIADSGFETAGSDSEVAGSAPSIAHSPESPIDNPRSAIESAFRTRHSGLLVYAVAGDGFLRHMVRAIVGTLVEVGRGRRPPEWIAEVIASGDRSAAGPTAPPEGLFLVGIRY
jgi:tRNA pseudouridine38-40 synthase